MQKRCMGCMQELKTGHICPKCAYDNQNWTNPARALPLRAILNGKYLIGAVIGEGGFGITYVAWDMLINSKVAIKEYFPSELATRDATFSGSNVSRKSLTLLNGANERLLYKKGLDRFVQEAEKLAKFRQLTGIVSVQDFFYENNTAYMVMEYIEGTTLRTYLQDHGEKLSVEETLQMMKPVMATLSEVHKEGIIHRDISPDNIMITRDGQLKLIDFGAARYVGGGDEKSLTVILKHGYAPEEQYRSDGKQGPWTDVYALCAVMYRMITGKVPEEPIQRMSERQDSVEKELAVSKDLDVQKRKALIKGLAVKRERRCQSVQKLYAALYQMRMVIPGKGLAGVGISAVVLCAIIVAAARVTAQKKGDDYPPAKNISLQEETEIKNAGTMEKKTETEVSEKEADFASILEDSTKAAEMEEPRNFVLLKEYYEENFAEFPRSKVFFYDLTGDGNDEMIIYYGEKIPLGENGEYGTYINYSLEVISVDTVNGYPAPIFCGFPDGCAEEFRRFGNSNHVEYELYDNVWSQNRDADGIVCYLATDGNKIFYMNKEKFYVVSFDNGVHKFEIDEQEYFQLTGVCISTMRESGEKAELETYGEILVQKEKLQRVLNLSEENGVRVLNYVEHHNEKDQASLSALSITGKSIYDVWSISDEKYEHIDRISDEIYEYWGYDILNFGRDEHYAVNFLYLDEIDQYKYYIANEKLQRIDNQDQFKVREDGRIGVYFYPENIAGYDNWISIFFRNSQYMEYGCVEQEKNVIEKYENYKNVIAEVGMQIESIGEVPVGQDNFPFTVESADWINLMYSEEGYYYLSYLLKGYYFEDPTDTAEKWCNVVLHEEGNRLKVVELNFGKRLEHSDLGYPVYYGEDHIEYPEKTER